jgi:hypothetical protein
VFFGATKATVTAASTTSLTVTVPSGATYEPITVINLGTALMGNSAAPFRVTFARGVISTTSFDQEVPIVTNDVSYNISIGDLDGDGKPDLVVANNSINTISVFRNTSSNGSISNSSFASKVDFTTGSEPIDVSIGDLDGDGKPDLVVANYDAYNVGRVGSISVFRNTASSGSITSSSFASRVDFTTEQTPLSVCIGDLDGDGKPDLVVSNYSFGRGSTISIFRNTASSGSITSSSFASNVDFTVGLAPASVSIGDLDGDSKPDLVVANNNSDYISVLRNTALIGSINSGSFGAKVDFSTGTSSNPKPSYVSIGDLDGDDKPDLVVANTQDSNISVLRNTASSGSITSSSFSGKVNFTTGLAPSSVGIGDLDGDGKPDLVAPSVGQGISVFRNTASNGSITNSSFASKVDFAITSFPYGLKIGDLDGDGKPDLVASNLISKFISVLHNNASTAAPVITPPGSLSVCSPSTLTLTASGCAGTVTWSEGAVTGTSLTLSAVGTYSITATCTDAGSTSVSSSAVTGMEIKAKPTAPTVTAPTEKVVCFPSTLTLTASGCAGTVTWSNAATGTSLTLSTADTYSITATCTVNGCISAASTAVTGLEIKAKPTAPTVTAPTEKVVCFPSTLTLTASGCAGTVTWSNAATGTSLPLSAVGTYSVTATCTVNGCISDASTAETGMEIKAKPTAPTVTAPTEKVVCFPSTLTLTASGCAGTVTWSNAATGTSLTLSAVGTYSVTATCTVNGCISDASTAETGMEIKAKPTAPTVTAPTEKVVCFPSTLTLTSSDCAGTVTWSNAATGTSLTLSTVGTYSITATCTVNGCISDASTAVTGLEIKAKPTAPTVTAPTEKVVCFPSTLTLTASGCAGTVTWSNAATGTSLPLSAVGTYSVTATCTVNNCISDAITAVTGMEIKAKPTAPTVTAPTEKVVCFPSTLTLTASGCAGTVTWSNAATGTSLTLSTVGTYSISATCTVNGCISDASTAETGMEIKAKPTAPTVTAPTDKVVCFPSTLTLTSSGCAGTVTWSNAVTGTSLTLSAVGTYSITATCTVNGCISDPSTAVTGLEIKAQPIISTNNTGPYTVGQTINLNGTGIGTYIWTGPNNFTSTLSNPTINTALSVNAGVYTLSVIGQNSCINTSTTNVVVNEIDPCDPTRIVEFIYVKAGDPYQTLFQLTNGMVINQMRDQVSILVNPVCPSVTIESFEMNIQGPELNWNILQNVPPNALFDNIGLDVWGRNFNPGNYTLTVTGYARDNKGGGITYGPKIIRFTVVGNLATINAPTLSKTSICAGSSVDVSFATSGTFNDINQYLIELSDTSGSFEKPLLIGTTNTTGTITCLIPQNILGGSKYLIRVKSSNQVIVSNPVISQVTVNPLNYSLVGSTNNLTGTSTKKAVDSINASNKISSPANVVYQAGKSVVLTPGFESSAVFRAEIKSCDN